MDVKELAAQIKQGNRRAIARGLTLVESGQAQHEALSLQLFEALGSARRAFRLGVTGPPGAGKSTLIERLVLAWLENGVKVAILTVDPSSRRTGGSLLGDKTRMGEIAQHPNVFIRPSPTGEHLGGLGRRTPLMCALLERAGFQRIVVETVGVGQSEVSVRFLVDQLLLVALPGAGDEVQGLKRGLMEEVDVVAVNKADLGQAKSTVAILKSAFRVFRREVPVQAVSAETGEGLEQLLSLLESRSETSCSESSNELHFLDEFLMETLWHLVMDESSEMRRLRQRVERGELDFLQALPELAKQTDHLRSLLGKASRI